MAIKPPSKQPSWAALTGASLRCHRQRVLRRGGRARGRRVGPVDVLVNNAGITQPLKFMDIAPENYDAVPDVKLRGTLYMSQAASTDARTAFRLDHLHVVGLRRAGRRHLRRPALQCRQGRRAGARQAMARELGPDGIRVNSVTPGLIQTDITGGKLTDDLKVEILKGIPLNRLGEADDVARACLFLASDLSSYITGATIDVNGGMLIH